MLFGAARRQWQDGVEAIPRLDRRFLIDGHDGGMRPVAHFASYDDVNGGGAPVSVTPCLAAG